MTKPESHKILIRDKGQKRLDISVISSHNKYLSDKGLIQIVKLLARKAAEEDYRHEIIRSNKGGN